ncbi:hypothetical protein F441_03271, partial [Phytophthora nicotianae CJ01A1]
RLTEIGDSIRSEHREIQRRYRENRRNRLATLFVVHRERVNRPVPCRSHRESPS